MQATIPTKEDLMQQQILAAGKNLFQLYGLAKVTMDDVAKAIGKGRSSLYYYYKSKDEIFDAVLKIEIRDMITAMTLAVDKAPGIEKKLHAFFLTKIAVLRKKREFFRMLDVGMDADTLSNFQKMKVVHHNLIVKQESALLERVLTEGMDDGQLRAMPAPELDTLIYVLLSNLRGLKRELELSNDAARVVPAVNMFTRMVMSGIKQ